ncbi:MAG: hypothetical protein FWC80_01390 [Firmicutes bacterium]|nr:hypothetical protein [Bacillota bacterium]
MKFEYKNNPIIAGYITDVIELKYDKNKKPYCYFDIKVKRLDLKVGTEYEFFDIRLNDDAAVDFVNCGAKAGWGLEVLRGVLRRTKKDSTGKRHEYIKAFQVKVFPPETAKAE